MEGTGNKANPAKILLYSLSAASLFGIAVYLVTAIWRLSYPFELEWMEGGMVVEVSRILQGKPLYVSPSIGYIPYIYTPLFMFLSAAAAKVTGIGFLPLRLVSFISTLLNVTIIYLLVAHETKSRRAGLWGAGIFCFTFAIGGAWFEIARPDSLALLFSLLSIYILRLKSNITGFIIAGLIISAAFWTKQSTLVMILPLAVYIFYKARWKVIYFLIPIVILVIGGDLIYNYLSGGWFNYFVFEVPAGTPIKYPVLVLFWTSDIIRPMPVAFALLIFFLMVQYNDRDRDRFVFYLMAAIGLIGSSLPGRIHPGGFLNVLIPAYAALSIFFAMGLYQVIKSLSGKKELRYLEIFVVLLALFQFVMLKYNPAEYIPSQSDRAAGNRLMQEIGSFKGEVIIPSHAYYGPKTGKNPYYQEVALLALEAGDPQLADKIKSELKDAIRDRKFDAMIVDALYKGNFIDSTYFLKDSLYISPAVFYPSTGSPKRPQYIYVPVLPGTM